MALDTRYRPRQFDDVIGQEGSVQVLRQFVRQGTGFHQSYLFCGGHGSGKCVVGSTLVPTQRGVLPIASLVGTLPVEPTDLRVVQEHGEGRAAYTYRGGVRETVRIRTHMGYEVEGTPNHRIRVLGVSGEIEWRCLGEVQDGDHACIVPRGIFGTGADLTSFSYEGHDVPGGFQSLPFKAPDTLTPEWGRLMGYLIGDGRCDSSAVEVSNSEDETKADVLGLLTRLCGYGYGTPDKRSTSGLENLRCSRVQPRAFLEYAGLGRWLSGDKEVPWSILASPAPVVREFLRGYLEADGSAGESGIEVTTKSKTLAAQVHVLLLQFGVIARLAPKRVEGYGEYHRITIDADSYVTFAERVEARHSRKTRLTNRYTVVPHQASWVRRFYANLPRGERTQETNHYFRCRRDECRCTAEKVSRIAEEYPHADVGTHFRDLHLADYHYDPIESVTPGLAEVFDLNVPGGEMFAANGFMNHNTTLGRILARALLCETPRDGDPCDECSSCRSILERGSSECFVEVDAATNSGKDSIQAILDLLQYDTFSGRRRIYLFDEAHRLSREALDALLKPMEDSVPGGEDKLLVCIFCTTEPEKMKSTIFSRCAPAFVIRKVPASGIADRLVTVCEAENIPFEREALELIAEVVESHIRDALKAVEGVATLGGVTVTNVRSYLRLNAVAYYLKVLACIGHDLARALETTDALLQVVSPSVAYERLAETCMLAYRLHLGVGRAPVYFKPGSLEYIGGLHVEHLLRFAEELSARPAHPTAAMLFCDVARLHRMRLGEWGPVVQVVQQIVAPPENRPNAAVETPLAQAPNPAPPDAGQASTSNAGRVQEAPPVTPPAPRESLTKGIFRPDKATTLPGGTYVDPRGVKRNNGDPASRTHTGIQPMDPGDFRIGLGRLLAEMALNGRKSGQA